MIKFSATIDKDTKLLGLGLSQGNIDKLKEGAPILIESSDLEKLTGWKGSIFILYGKNETEIQKKLVPFMNSHTRTIEKDTQ